jgi:hypothetical protein
MADLEYVRLILMTLLKKLLDGKGDGLPESRSRSPIPSRMNGDRSSSPNQPKPAHPHKFRFETTIPYPLTDRQGFLSSLRSQQLTIAQPNPLQHSLRKHPLDHRHQSSSISSRHDHLP